MLAFANAPQNATITGYATFGDSIDAGGGAEVGKAEGSSILSNIFGSGSDIKIGTFLTDFISPEKLDTTLIKYAFFILLIFLIISVLSIAEFPKNPIIRFLLALPVSYLSIVLIKPEEILSASILYSALGMTFIVALPLVIMILFTSQILQGKLGVGKILIQLIAWYFYLAFLVYFLIRALTHKTLAGETGYSGGVIAIIVIGIGLSIFIIWKNKKFRGWIREKAREVRGEAIKDIGHAKKAHEEEVAGRAKSDLESSEDLYKRSFGKK